MVEPANAWCFAWKGGSILKLLVTIVQDQDANTLMGKLSEKGFQFTKVSSTGGFLREGNTTLLIGLRESRREEEVLSIIKENSQSREISSEKKAKVTVGGAKIFALDVEGWETY